MQTLVTLPGDDLHVYAYRHRDARHVGKIRGIDVRIGWVWSRHGDTISGWHTAEKDLTDRQRQMFAIDWAALEAHQPNVPSPRGRYFR
jgi:hypothetical protein